MELVSNRPLDDLPSPKCTYLHSPIFRYLYKEKQIIDLKKMVQELVSKRPLDLPSQRCTSEHSPIFKQLCAPRSRSVNQCQYQKELDLCTQQQQNILQKGNNGLVKFNRNVEKDIFGYFCLMEWIRYLCSPFPLP